ACAGAMSGSRPPCVVLLTVSFVGDTGTGTLFDADPVATGHNATTAVMTAAPTLTPFRFSTEPPIPEPPENGPGTTRAAELNPSRVSRVPSRTRQRVATQPPETCSPPPTVGSKYSEQALCQRLLIVQSHIGAVKKLVP